MYSFISFSGFCKSKLVVLILLFSISFVWSLSFSDVEYWVGEGENQCGLVLDWNDGKEPRSLMWGFRWNGEATGQDLIDAVVSEDSRLRGDIDAIISELIYDLDNNNFIDVNDHNMGMNEFPQGYWSYWVKELSDDTWAYSNDGIGGRVLSDGCWDGWVFVTDWADSILPYNPVPAEIPQVIDYPIPFEDIVLWAGEGENQAALILDWNDNQEPESLVWGVRFNNETTGIEMLTAVSELDLRLIVEGESFLEHLTFLDHSSVEGSDYWSTWSWSEESDWFMNSGLSSVIENNMAFGCSYGFSPATQPDYPSPVEAEESNNEAPQANNDIYQLRNDLAYDLYILDNDTDDDELDFASISLITEPLYGDITISELGYLTYQGNGDYVGIDLCEYTIQDIEGATSNPATLEINLLAAFAGVENSTGISYSSELIVNWASEIEIVRGSEDISNPDAPLASYGEVEDALGQASEDTALTVSLGDGGIATLTFEQPITNGAGYDFAVFENSFSDTALELAFVEVSSDGLNFVRFPAISLTQVNTQITNSGVLEPESIHNLAGKYRVGVGTPFDLEELRDSLAVNIDSVSFVRIIDVVGSINPEYASYDVFGSIINDPFPTPFSSAGFDLSGVAVMNQLTPVGSNHNLEPITSQISLNHAYPNPFNPETTLSFSLPARSRVNLSVYNLKGQLVRELVSSELKKGDHLYVWNGKNDNNRSVSSGVYFYRLKADSYSQTRKIILQK